MSFALLQADLWILGIYLPKDSVAIYGAASRLCVLVGMPMLIINAFVPPMIAELNARRQELEMESVLRFTATLASVPALIAAGLLIGMSQPIMELGVRWQLRRGAPRF